MAPGRSRGVHFNESNNTYHKCQHSVPTTSSSPNTNARMVHHIEQLLISYANHYRNFNQCIGKGTVAARRDQALQDMLSTLYDVFVCIRDDPSLRTATSQIEAICDNIGIIDSNLQQIWTNVYGTKAFMPMWSANTRSAYTFYGQVRSIWCDLGYLY